MQAFLWRVAGWLTWGHIQWLMVQMLGDKGLYHALFRVVVKLSVQKFRDKTWDSITLSEAMEALKPE